MKSLTTLVMYYLTYVKINIYNFTNENENLSSTEHLQLCDVPSAVCSLGNGFNNMKGTKLENGSQIYPLTMQTFLALVP